MKNISLVLCGLWCGLVTTVLAEDPAAAPASAESTAVVARVNGDPIYRRELDNAVRAITLQFAHQGRPISPAQSVTMDRDLVQELVRRQLILQEGRKREIPDLETKVKTMVDQSIAQVGGEEQFARALSDAGSTPEEFARQTRENIIIQEAIQAAVGDAAAVSDEEVEKFYQENKDKFQQPAGVRASHILIRVPADASDADKAAKRAQLEALQARVKNGEDFAALASEFSEDPGSKPRGGDLGFFQRGRMVPEFDEAVFALKPNEVSDIVTTQFGYHLIKLTDQQAARELSFDEVRERIAQGLKLRKRQEALNKHITELLKSAQVEILLPSPAAP